MSISIRLLTLTILFLLSTLVHAQTPNYQYQLDGSYTATLPWDLSTRNVRFTMLWNESNSVVTGVYQDSLFVAGAPVTGTAGIQGRVFNIKLPRIIQGISNLSITANIANISGGNLPVMVFMRDQAMNTVNQSNTNSIVTIRSDYVEPAESACDIGFGVISGFCGLYTGRLNESTDSTNKCNLPDYGFRMELSADATTNLYFYYSDIVPGTPVHKLGAFASAPVTSNVNVTTRHCGTLPGTSFSEGTCQVLSLTGNYTDVGAGKNFQGKYQITEESSGANCVYDINVDREKAY
jgi:hypothetical protein